MKLLAVETSTRPGSIALLENERVLEQVTLEQPGRRHAQLLHVSAKAMLANHGLAPADVGAIAVSIGPGSFTGLRVGVVFAKTFAYVTECKIAAVDSHLAVAFGAESLTSKLTVISDAQRRELFVGEYARTDSGGFVQTKPITIAAQADWLSTLTDEHVAGPSVEKLAEQLPSGVTIAAVSSHEPTAAAVGQVGHRMVANDELTDAWQLVPFYLRRSAAEENWERRQAGLSPV